MSRLVFTRGLQRPIGLIRLIAAPLLFGTLLGAGCTPPAPPSANIELPIGAELSGTLGDSQSKTFELAVQAGVYYAVSIVGSAGNVGIPDLGAQIIGPTAPEGVALTVRGLSVLRPEDVKGFRALEDGVLEIVLENHTEGLTAGSGFLANLLGSPTVAHYRIKATELGRDDNGSSPEEATRLVDDGQALTGTILFGSTYDYFTFPAVEGRQYSVTFEASGPAKLATSDIDRFDQFIFGVPEPGTRAFMLAASAGKPATLRVTAFKTIDVPLAVAAGTENLLQGILDVPAGMNSFPLQYAITVTSKPGGNLTSGVEIEDVVSDGYSLDYFIDVPEGATRITTTLTGAPELICYINPNELGSIRDFQAVVSPLVLGLPGISTVPVVFGAKRYYFSVGVLDSGTDAFVLKVTVE